jgi:hypothetical protein
MRPEPRATLPRPMAKRTRYPSRTSSRAAPKRPARLTTSGAAPVERAPAPAEPIELDATLEPFEEMPLRSSSSLTEAEVSRAAELEAEATAKERAAIAESLRRRQRGDERELVHRGADINAPLSVRMAHEYAYVARDVRRILLTAGLMVAILAVLAILINVLQVISI